MYFEYTSTRKQVLTSVIKIVFTILLVIFYTSFILKSKHNYYNNDNIWLLMTFESGFKIFNMSQRK